MVGMFVRAGKAIKKLEKKADIASEKFLKQLNSKDKFERTKGYSKLLGITLGAGAAMPSTVK